MILISFSFKNARFQFFPKRCKITPSCHAVGKMCPKTDECGEIRPFVAKSGLFCGEIPEMKQKRRENSRLCGDF
jgi:hypothetical protein